MKTKKECYAVIFTSIKTGNTDGYDQAAIRMFELATQQTGFISIDHSQMGNSSITISYWESEEAILNWKNHHEHILTQEKGKSTWYKSFDIRVAKVFREYSFEQPSPQN